MKKRGLLLLAAIILLLLTGCSGGDTADKYIGGQITMMKNEDAEKFSLLLDKGTADSNAVYVLQFPKELEEPYLAFLQEAFSKIEFEVAEAKENGEHAFSVLITCRPLDIADATAETTERYLSGMSSPDLDTEAGALLAECREALQEPLVFGEETNMTINIEKGDDGFSVKDEELAKLLSLALPNYMAPYDKVCEILDKRDFLQSYLDASFKGELGQFAKHTGLSEEKAAAWYEEDTFELPEGVNSAYADRYKAALKKLAGQCKYVVGIPRKASGPYNYTVDVTVTPNTSLTAILSEMESGTFYSEEEVDQAFIGLLEKYAASPAYGEETVVTMSLNLNSFSGAGAGTDTEIDQLVRTILVYGD